MEGLVAPPPSLSLALGATPGELAFIATLCDAGDDADRHLAELKALLAEGGQFSEQQVWYPFEVVERGAAVLHAGHEREFAICLLLWLQALSQGRSSMLDPVLHVEDRAMEIESLPAQLRDVVLDAFLAAGC